MEAGQLIRKGILFARTRCVLATIYCMLVALALGGCGEGENSVVARDSVFDEAAVQQRADALYLTIGGSGEQREAVHFLTFKELNSDFVRCMADSGQPVIAEFVTLWSGWTPNPTSARWMGKLGVLPSRLTAANADAAYLEQPLSGTEAERVHAAEYQEAMTRCSDEGDGQVVDLGELPGRPEGADELMAEFARMVENADDSLGPINPYYECMSASGVEVEPHDGLEGVQALYDQLASLRPLPPRPGHDASQSWNKYLQSEAQAVEADATCRADMNARGLAELAGDLEAFEADHREELRLLAEEWDATLARATALGIPAD